MIWSIDGIEWDVPCSITRVSEVKSSEISGMLLDKSYFNDVIGTYLRYSVRMAVPFDRLDQYTQIYEALTDPVDGHIFVFPYAGSQITVTGRVESVEDHYIRLASGAVYWKGISFEVAANHPTKENHLDETLAKGMSPLPMVLQLPDGTVATLINGEWTFQIYENADEKYY